MTKIKLLAIGIAFTFSVSCTTDRTIAASEATVTIGELRNNPEKFYGQKITVAGYITIEFENYNLWATPKDEKKHNCRNAIGVNYSNDKALYKFNRSYVVISGVFDTWCNRDNLPEGEDLVCVSTGSCGTDDISPDTIDKLK